MSLCTVMSEEFNCPLIVMSDHSWGVDGVCTTCGEIMDEKTIYQKALINQILEDIRTDESIINENTK